MLSKIERGERKAKKEQVVLFADLYKVNRDELLPFGWRTSFMML